MSGLHLIEYDLTDEWIDAWIAAWVDSIESDLGLYAKFGAYCAERDARGETP